MTDHPYKAAPTRAFWRRSVSTLQAEAIDPVTPPHFDRIDKSTKVVSAGSCFASNIARYLIEAGHNYLVTENLHPAVYSINPGWWKKLGYGVYSAHYENIYTPLQMHQTLLRAYGISRPIEDRWVRDDGAVIDPFRPNLPHPANSVAEFDLLQQQHYQAVRAAFEQAEVFVFTLGLTEAWRSKQDGFVFPVCPGTIEGAFDPSKHEFVNFTVEEIHEHVKAFCSFLREKNPSLRIILTVSPVPLVATATENHVVAATVYSKSVLRVAAEMASQSVPNLAYFPSYEIICGPQASGAYFKHDRRSVSEDGIKHVMRLFFEHFTTNEGSAAEPRQEVSKDAQMNVAIAAAEERACEEEMVEINARRSA